MWHILVDAPHWALLKRRLLLATPLALVLLVVVAWLLDSRAHSGEPLRNVEVGGRAVGGLDPDALEAAIADVAEEYADAEIVIHTDDDDLETTAAAVGLAIDVEATADKARAEGRDDLLPLRPLRWLTGLAGGREAGVVVTVDQAMVQALVSAEDPTHRTEPVEPGITGDNGEIAVVLGEDGMGLDAGSIADAIVEAAASGSLPIEVLAEPVELSPRFSRDDAEALAEQAEELTDAPLAVTAGETAADIPASTIRSWMRSESSADGLELALDDEEALADLAELLAGAGTTPEDARFSVDGGQPVILRGVVGTACCTPEAVGLILDALSSDDDGPLDLPMRDVDPEHTSAELEALGIVEEIGSFTTTHKAGESRVTNIHRIADIVRGVVIDPGDTFSINGFVGRRTTDNGFVTGGVIENGSFAESVGGGISQFATTTFNAAFFGGLDLVEYQSHSIYISRYPYGREATLSFPGPDLVIGNSTPHGVLIWPTYTGTSITVTLYSTQFAKGAQTNQTEAPVGVAGCKRVTTERTRTFVDGHTEIDRVFAVYRPAEGVQCDGPAPAPAATTTTTAPPPPAEETTTTTEPPASG